MKDDAALFLAEMADVKPLTQDGSVLPQTKVDNSAQQLKLQRSRLALQLQKLTIEPGSIAPTKPDDILSFKNQGVQKAVFKQFRLGHYPVQASIDIHQFSVIKARSELLEFLTHAKQMEWRNVLVIHGKGEKSRPFPGLMKSFVNDWLMNIEGVMAFHSAPQLMGATGALLVMLEKSANQKMIARETNYKGAGVR
ncbi:MULTISPECIES: DNA endonuclease SmrA [Shewanella]|uniref:DNA endonuclease SmrA n=1 Tax=Shewanella TaxID=22 RepID=UPI0004AE2809|nr:MULTISPECIES: DNA endonuclease SmrA [Shewanella]QLE85653.1 DNA endonuclease SmrA [Shewanella sp. Scap07]